MHTTTWQGVLWDPQDYSKNENETVEVTILHDGTPGYQEMIVISLPNSVAQMEIRHFSEGGEDKHLATMRVPWAAIEAFVLNRMRDQLISRLETLNQDELRGYFTK